MKRRIVSVLMALVMALSLLPVQALAEDAAVEEPVTKIEQAEQTGKGEEPGDPEEQTGEGEEPGDPEEEQEPGGAGGACAGICTGRGAADGVHGGDGGGHRRRENGARRF